MGQLRTLVDIPPRRVYAPGMARAIRHVRFAESRGHEPTTCDGFVRRLYVRPGGGRWWVAIGDICDGCGLTVMEEGWQRAVAEMKGRAREARERRFRLEPSSEGSGSKD